MNLRRVGILVLRYVFVYRRSVIRLVEVWFWPTMELLLWGYVTLFLQRVGEGAVPRLVMFLIGAMILWDVLYRAQQGITLSFLEDVWVRNLLNIFCAPVRLSEYIAATFLFGLVRVGVTLVSLAALAWALYRFDLFEMGFALIPFMANLLILGLALGIITTAIILRFGQAAEALAWAVPFLIQPFAAVFYPVSVLPPSLQAIARAIPCTYVFEGMREVLRSGTFRWDHFGWALGLNVLYLAFGIWLLVRMFDLARERGLLGRLTMQ
ncbi:MAG: ABC transporter permease [Blastocatellia bacterium]|nr:ABC transporter permease [Blastocatellia bacterium]MCS7156236.1 ABC transporter permease [Blastocatellia bacterium]MCX7751414.1 ABC transporter permease [Blastocatellia bacterium]MDW8169127.1 ABC transporter permease [Acidobacteriota bacterium]MDW8255988.1 ABC transporter permease [Acidobacteriota bacterium]